jgi:hydroxymethylpyrimidine kinase/phosphomethylpyrimidine kinase
MRIALAIAGSDPTGGAGLQADLQVLRARGVHGMGVVTALTVQDTARVHQVLPAFPSVVRDQLRVLLRDVTPHAVKIGMLATDDVLRAVALGLDALEGAGDAPSPPLVLDPVLRASDGTLLLERRAWGGLRELVGRVALVTPNLPEAEALVERDVSSRAGVEAAARDFVRSLGAGAALVKGGHAEGAPDDCLARREGSGVRVDWLPGERVEGAPVHGTGCALSSAIAAELARGADPGAAVDAARTWLRGALRTARAPGHGARLLGPA